MHCALCSSDSGVKGESMLNRRQRQRFASLAAIDSGVWVESKEDI